MTTPQPRSLAIPFAVCCAAVLLFAIMGVTIGMVLFAGREVGQQVQQG